MNWPMIASECSIGLRGRAVDEAERAPRARAVLVGLLLAVAVCFGNSPATAQVEDRGAPAPSYFGVFPSFYEGEYKDALKSFEDHVRGCIKTSQSRWIDSICYETMVGECYYEMGLLDDALTHYTTALRLYVALSDWMIRVQFSPTIRPMTTVRPVPWGRTSRTSRLGLYPATTLMAQGEINVNAQIKRGGVVTPPSLYPVNVQEIVRCTCLAMRRRTKILGPTSSYDPLSQELANTLARRPGPPNHWSEAWINVQLGLAMVGAGKEAQGINALKQSLVAGGEYDHPLTCVALLELGRLSLGNGDYPSAAKYFEEATYSAFHYDDLGVLEEALRYGTLTHMLANRTGVYPPLAAVAQWAKVKDYRQLRASVLLSAAESCAFMGQAAPAKELLAEAHLAVGRRDMGRGRIGAKASYLTSVVSFQQGRVAEGDTALATTMGYMQHGSFWLYHIKLADVLCMSKSVTPRVAMEMYGDVLRDPQPADWQSDPMEAMAVLVTPHPGPYEHWFEISLDRQGADVAIEIADRARRHRYFSALPFGGRLLSLRWVLEAPVEMLDQAAVLHRQDLLARYPAYAKLSQQARALRTTLTQAPLVPPDQETAKQQGAALQQLFTLSVAQEAILREMAVRREPAALVFPPLKKTQDIQRSLPPGHALLIFFATSRQMYGFLLNNEKYSYWSVANPQTLGKQMQGLLRDWNLVGPNSEVTLKELADAKWKTSAAQVLDGLMKGSKADFTQKFDELIIVPDGVLWYLPFEALQVKIDGQLRPLLSRVRIRYVPTAALAMLPMPGSPLPNNTAVVSGKMYPREDADVAPKAFEQLVQVLPGAVQLRNPLPAAASVYATLFHRLIVSEDLPLAGQGPLEWSPVPLDRGKAGNTLADWLSLPWGGPTEIILPGFHTAAEDALKNVNRVAPGHEVFLSTCALMSTGARTILLSRWRTGGQTSRALVREFAQELPHTSASEAWQRAVLVTANTRIDPAAEPRLKATAVDELPKANHPFFWAGYMLIDAGPKPSPAAEPADENLFKIKQPGEPAKAEPPKKDAPAEPK